MEVGDAELGKLTKDHLEAHEQVANRRAELEQIGENLVLLGETLKNRPQTISFEEAKLTLKDSHFQEKTVLLRTLDLRNVIETVEDLSQAVEREAEWGTS